MTAPVDAGLVIVDKAAGMTSHDVVARVRSEVARERFVADHGRRGMARGAVVVILSDGYDTDPAERLGLELARLKRRRCKIVWLNPLKGWKGYEPVARGMAAALPHLDLFAAANTLEKLEALEPHLRKV